MLAVSSLKTFVAPLFKKLFFTSKPVSDEQQHLILIRPVLFMALLCLSAIWLAEYKQNIVSNYNLFAYPLLAMCLLCCLLYSYRNLQITCSCLLMSVSLYFYGSYSYNFIFQELLGITSTYNLASISQWLPILYVGAFLLLSSYCALIFSLCFMLALYLPEVFCFLGNDIHSPQAHALTINIILSHPVYICLLWGVSYIKALSRQARKNAKSMHQLAQLDSLTEILNRRGCEQAMIVAVAKFKRDLAQYSVLLIDIDHFKNINDTYGHLVGDEVLKKVAAELKKELRNFDVLGRWGGEEFLVLVEYHNQNIAFEIAERMRQKIENLEFSERKFNITASIGVAYYDEIDTSMSDQQSITTVISKADQALYQAKYSGRNRTIEAQSNN